MLPDTPALVAEDLTCIRNDRTLFTGLSFQLRVSQALLLEGRNGSGKTTLLRALAGLLLPESGEIRWRGNNIRGLREEYSRHLLYLGHLNGIKGDLTAVENLRIGSILDGFALDERRAWEVLGEIGLRGHEDLPSKHLSQGQKRRVALARLLVRVVARVPADGGRVEQQLGTGQGHQARPVEPDSLRHLQRLLEELREPVVK